MTDLASLVLAVDSTQVKTGVASLDGLTAAGARAEAATLGLGRGSKTAGAAAAAMAANAQLASRAAVGLTGGATTASLAMQSLGTKSHASSLQIRESLVLMREASVGNFTRMAGSASILAGSLSNTGSNVGALAKQLLVMVGVLKVTQDAALAEEATQAAASAASVEAYAQRVAGAIAAADTELALAEAAVRVAATSEAEAAAQVELAAAHEAVAAAAAQAVIAEDALAVAQGRAAAAGAASTAATVTSLGTLGAALLGGGAAVGVLVGGFKVLQSQVSNDHTLDNYAKSLGLSKKEMKELRQEVGGFTSKEMQDLETRARAFEVTWGDVWHGLNKTASDALDLSPAWQRFKNDAASAFVSAMNSAQTAASYIYAVWSSTIDRLNSKMAYLSGVIGNAYRGMAAPPAPKDGADFWDDVGKKAAEAQKQISKNLETIRGNIIGAAEARIKGAADAIIEDRTPKKSKKVSDHGLADALAELDAQIKGQNALAAAYQVSDAAAIKAEAMQKAEEQAIRHKGEVGIFYEKELALAIAQGAAEGAKRIADLRYEADSRASVNSQVAAGLIPASQANAALELESQLRPLTARLALADGKAKSDLLDIIRNLTKAYGDNLDQIARGIALAEVASKANDLDKLKLETELIGASNRVRAVRLAQLEAEQFIKNNATPEDEQGAVTKAYVDAANAATTLQEKQDNYNASLTATLDMLKLIEEQSQTLGQIMSDAFGPAGNAIGGIVNSLASWQAQQEQINHDAEEARKKAGNDAVALANIEATAAQRSKNAQLQAIGGVLGGLKSLFKEHSAGYKAMEAAEKAFAIIQLISTVKSIAAGAAKMFSQLGAFAFPAVAAMIAVMAGLGFSGGGSGGGAAIPNTDDLQAKQGAGTVLGDATAKSDSIAHSLDIMEKNSVQGLNYTADMVRSLRMIESGIGKLAGNIARDIQVGNLFDTSGLNLGTSTKQGFSLLGGAIGGLFGGLLGGKSTQLRELADQGIILSGSPLNLASHYKNQALFDAAMKGVSDGSVADILANGLYGASYTRTDETNTKSGILGIGGGSSSGVDYDTGALSQSILDSFTSVIGSIRDSILNAADIVGLSGAQALIDAFKVHIGQISFEGMSGKEIEDQLNAVFSSIGDQMTEAAFPALKELQKVGEGLFETFMRVAKDYATIDAALSSIGMSFGAVGVASLAARERLVDLAGGLDEFVSQTDFFFDHFFSDADKIAFAQSQVSGAFAQLGIAAPDTLAEFKALVSGLNLSTDAGQNMFEALMTIAPAFYQVDQAVRQFADKQAKMQIQLLQAQGDAAGALALQRQAELAAMDESLRGLQQQIYAAQDLAKAKDNLLSAYKRESQALQTTVDKFTGFAKGLKEFRDSLFSANDAQLSYNQALAKLISVGSLASAGDETALGGLQDASQKFLDVATQNAGSLQDVERARALVARYLDQAIGGAEGQASIAQQQLDQMKDQVSALVDIDDHILTVAEAIQQLNALLTPSSSTSPAAAFAAPQVDKAAQEKLQASLDSIQAATEQNAVSSNQTARILARADRGGALAVFTDDDTPLVVVGP